MHACSLSVAGGPAVLDLRTLPRKIGGGHVLWVAVSLVGFREFPLFLPVFIAAGLHPPQPASRSIGILSRRGSAAFCDEGEC
ncbi:hypothetical protein CLJ1_5749 [Pseudomonas paraeruginosa]|nr:hypothetical protein CLJ1_5749 [Pseudomonas aeruginosa]